MRSSRACRASVPGGGTMNASFPRSHGGPLVVRCQLTRKMYIKNRGRTVLHVRDKLFDL